VAFRVIVRLVGINEDELLETLEEDELFVSLLVVTVSLDELPLEILVMEKAHEDNNATMVNGNNILVILFIS
jgi:hypothetical protein